MALQKGDKENGNDDNVTSYREESILFGVMTISRRGSFWFPAIMYPTTEKFSFIENLPMRDDDVLVCSFPKSGT